MYFPAFSAVEPSSAVVTSRSSSPKVRRRLPTSPTPPRPASTATAFASCAACRAEILSRPRPNRSCASTSSCGRSGDDVKRTSGLSAGPSTVTVAVIPSLSVDAATVICGTRLPSITRSACDSTRRRPRMSIRPRISRNAPEGRTSGGGAQTAGFRRQVPRRCPRPRMKTRLGAEIVRSRAIGRVVLVLPPFAPPRSPALARVSRTAPGSRRWRRSNRDAAELKPVAGTRTSVSASAKAPERSAPPVSGPRRAKVPLTRVS